MVVDTSILLAVMFGEPRGEWAAGRLNENAGALLMSTVNLAETLILLQDRQPARFPALETEIFASGITFAAPDAEQARIAARARLRFPLNLGDCFAYALARVKGCPLLTLDEDFRAVDVAVLLP